MSKSKDMLQEAVKALYEEGKRRSEIRSLFDTVLEENDQIYVIRDIIVQAIFDYVDKVHPDMRNTYTKEDLEKFTTDQIFGTINKDLDELRTLKADGYTKVSSSETCRGTKTAPGLEGYDDEALKAFLRTL